MQNGMESVKEIMLWRISIRRICIGNEKSLLKYGTRELTNISKGAMLSVISS